MSAWTQRRVKYLAAINQRALPETTSPDREIRYVDISTVGRGVLTGEPQLMTFETAPSRARRLVVPGDTIVSTVRTYLRAVLPLPDPQPDLVASTGFAVLSPTLELNPRYFGWVVQSDPFVDELVARSVGVSYPAINASEIGDLRISVPPAHEQRAIADYLDAETARIDELVANKRRMIKLLEERWRAAVRREVAQLISAHGARPLKRFVRCLDGRRVPLSAEERAGRRGEFPYYGASGVVDHIDDFLFDETLVLLGEDGAQLADPDYEISLVVDGKVWVNNHAHVLRPMGCDAYFLAIHLATFDRGSVISGSTREKITQDDMNGVAVPNIGLGQQREVGGRWVVQRDTSRHAVEALNRQIGLLAERRQALITAAVTGELVPGVAA